MNFTRNTVALLLLGLMLFVPQATAQGTAPVEVQIETHSDGGEFWFECSGAPTVCGDGRNPVLTLEADKTYTFHVSNPSSAGHDLNLGGALGEATAFLNAGEEDTLTVTVPDGASGEAEYWCNPHRSAGMKGTLVFTAAQGDGDGGAENGSPGLGALPLAGVLLGALLVADRTRR